MLAAELATIGYLEARENWREVNATPTWPQIEAAVRPLERAQYPFLHILG